MSKVVWHITMSADGFIAGPDDDMEWVFEYPDPSAMAEEVIRTTGSILVGRRTYEVEDRDRGGFYGGSWHGPYFVLTHDPPATAPDWMTGEFIDEDIEPAIARARTAAAGKNVAVFGASIARQCIARNLLDDIVIHMAPVLLGDGVRLFDADGAGRVDLERIEVMKSGQLTDLRFRLVSGKPADERPVRSEVSDERERTAVAQAIIDTNRYMVLGTADAEGTPWTSPVWYAPRGHGEFFWVSDPGARHSLNIAARRSISIVIFDSTLPISSGQAVYMPASAEQVTGAEEVELGMAVFSRRSQHQGARAWFADEVGPGARLRLYRAVASEHFVLSAQDKRIPVTLA